MIIDMDYMADFVTKSLRNRFSFWPFYMILVAVVVSGCMSDPVNVDDKNVDKPFRYTQAPGYSAEAFLSDSSYTNLEVEIDYMLHQKPNKQALDSLKQFLQNRLHKTTITFDVASQPLPSSGASSPKYTSQDIQQMEQRYRSGRTNGETLSTYLVIVDGTYSDDGDVLGMAYFNSSIVLFGKNINDHSGDLGQPPRYKLEATVLEHEFGHLMGLVANGTPMVIDHKSEKHNAHCNNQDCLMYYAAETTDFVSNMFDGSIPDLDANCIRDLQANGGR